MTDCAGINAGESSEQCASVSTFAEGNVEETDEEPEQSIQDQELFLTILEDESNTTSADALESAADVLVSEVEVNLEEDSTEPLAFTASASVAGDLTTTDLSTAFLSAAASSAAAAPASAERWRELARTRAQVAMARSYSKLYAALSKPVQLVSIAKQPQLCTQVTRSIVDTCKKGVRAQVASCKAQLRTQIADCKNEVRASIDRCKRRKKSYDAFGKAQCESARANIPKCELSRVDVPFCEFDRLTAACCEGSRPQAQALCYSGLSSSEIERRVQSVQAKCSIATGIAKAATKSYLTGQVLGVLTQVQAVKEIDDGVKLVNRVQTAQRDLERYANGLAAAAEGRYDAARRQLGGLATTIVANTAAYAEQAQVLVGNEADRILGAASKAVAELEVVQKVKSTIESLNGVANDVRAIQRAARDCAKVTDELAPITYPEIFDLVTIEADVQRAVADFEKAIAQKLFAVARCQAVVARLERVVKVAF